MNFIGFGFGLLVCLALGFRPLLWLYVLLILFVWMVLVCFVIFVCVYDFFGGLFDLCCFGVC